MHVKKRNQKLVFTEFVDKVRSQISKMEQNPLTLFTVSRYFFSHYFHLKHAFTYEELKDEVIKSRIDTISKNKIACLADRLSEIKYGPNKPRTKELRELREKFKEIFLVLTETKLDSLDKIKDVKNKAAPVKSIFSNVSKVVGLATKKSLIEPTSKITTTEETFYEKINEIKYMHENNQDVKEKYHQLTEMYSKLSLKNRKQVFPEFTKLHAELSGQTDTIDCFYYQMDLLDNITDTKDAHRIKTEYLHAMELYEKLPSYEKDEAYKKIKEIHSKIKIISSV